MGALISVEGITKLGKWAYGKNIEWTNTDFFGNEVPVSIEGTVCLICSNKFSDSD